MLGSGYYFDNDKMEFQILKNIFGSWGPEQIGMKFAIAISLYGLFHSLYLQMQEMRKLDHAKATPWAFSGRLIFIILYLSAIAILILIVQFVFTGRAIGYAYDSYSDVLKMQLIMWGGLFLFPDLLLFREVRKWRQRS